MTSKKEFSEGKICQSCKEGNHKDCAYSIGVGYSATKCPCNCNIALPTMQEDREHPHYKVNKYSNRCNCGGLMKNVNGTWICKFEGLQ